MLEVAEGTPVIGHVTAGVYAATGDLEKAEDVAIGATKSTVIGKAIFLIQDFTVTTKTDTVP